MHYTYFTPKEENFYINPVHWERRERKGFIAYTHRSKYGLFCSSAKFRYNAKDLLPCWEACVYSGKTSKKSLSPAYAREHPHLMTFLFQYTGATGRKNLHQPMKPSVFILCVSLTFPLGKRRKQQKMCYFVGCCCCCCVDSPILLLLNLLKVLSDENPDVQWEPPTRMKKDALWPKCPIIP